MRMDWGAHCATHRRNYRVEDDGCSECFIAEHLPKPAQSRFAHIVNDDESTSVFVDPSKLGDLNWRLRYAPEEVTRKDQVVLASLCSTYSYLLLVATQKRLCEVRRKVREVIELHRVTKKDPQ